MRRSRWMIIAALPAGAAAMAFIAGAFLCEHALRPTGSRQPFATTHHTGGQPVAIAARDGVRLSAQLFETSSPNRGCVLVLHGVAASARSAAGFAAFLLAAGYTVLAPNSRGHGDSADALVTYGVRESDDLQRWVDFLSAYGCPRGAFGLGESFGAAVLLQSISLESRFHAVIAECSFASFERIAQDRLAQRLPFPLPLGRLLSSPVVAAGFLFARWKYDIDLHAASPQTSVASTRTPILLIHGLEDRNIPPYHAELIRSANPSQVTLWLVPGAGHTGAFAADPEKFKASVLDWFRRFSPRPPTPSSVYTPAPPEDPSR